MTWNYKAIQNELNNQGRTRKWLARELGISPGSLSMYLCGARAPAFPLGKLMSIILNVPLADLNLSPHSTVRDKTTSAS